MILIDSSVWIDFFKGKNQPLVEEVRRLLDLDLVGIAEPVRIELLSGASRSEWERLRRVFSALSRFSPSNSSWALIEEWIQIGLRSGQRFGAFDLLVAAIACENHAVIWTLDKDFSRMQKLGFVQLHHWDGEA